MKNAKAQFWSIDVIFSIVIFTVALTLLAYTWYNINNQLALSYSDGSTVMSIQAFTMSGTLMTPGYPINWQDDVNLSDNANWNEISIGLLKNGSDQISNSKLYTFIAMANSNYQATKTSLGASYNYYIVIRGSGINIKIGRNPALYNATSVVRQTSSAMLNNMQVSVIVETWTNGNLAVD
ncbi:hypothetical protein Mia14_0176 [Candidatus Mancarchaeum acidiphilum]|uniref:Uncharacterized protein n=1 Tax=Candidatus Mancarchaeum acidiphilum TaxID=1920749 RepID=A0A218NM30_9ARCH|nr:hypothetical protein [Candidatus Mancarchaeum acidiphilum]ASI13512.1 hypothetical protein Mia14_0176 [Candidatus Mancarchaeum acidiphilum]